MSPVTDEFNNDLKQDMKLIQEKLMAEFEGSDYLITFGCAPYSHNTDPQWWIALVPKTPGDACPTCATVKKGKEISTYSQPTLNEAYQSIVERYQEHINKGE